ncbi:hypothetical protein LguiB_006190 [Lonicera macranthoides]
MDLLEVVGAWKVNRLERDCRLWVGEKSGVFSSNSFFEKLTSSDEERPFSPYNMIWKSGVPPKAEVLAWLSAWTKVNTYDVLQSRNPFLQISQAWCTLCRREGESIDHLLMHCPFAQFMWNNIRRELDLVTVFPYSWFNLLSISWSWKGNKKKSRILWRWCCLAVMWCLWKERNTRTFEDKEKGMEETWQRIKALASLWASSSKAFGILSISEIFRDCSCYTLGSVFSVLKDVFLI